MALSRFGACYHNEPELHLLKTSGCGVLLDFPKNSPQQRVFVPSFLTLAITQSDSHKPLTLKFC
jgi:hypothetical protein